ncbi:MAG: sugar phosphate isomerase/epimerase, partial [Pedosphaera sp.]|nr:sugar phosphate isomerase/epimerase [Pedosphaera sp.]
MKRRIFLKLTAGATLGLSMSSAPLAGAELREEPFKISLAEWSFNKTLRAGKMTNLDFPRVAKKEFDIDCI